MSALSGHGGKGVLGAFRRSKRWMWNTRPGAWVNMKFSNLFLNYPKGYNPKVHGPFYRWQNYTGVNSFWELKMKELPAWLIARDYSPTAVYHTIRRYLCKFKYDTLEADNAGVRGVAFWLVLYVVFMCYQVGFYNIPEAVAKYHW